MAEAADSYTNAHGQSLFDLVDEAYDHWLADLPYVHADGESVTAETHLLLMREVWPAVQQLCIRLEANGNAPLGARLELAFRNVEDYARIIDNYCQSDKFDFHLWAYGDRVLDTLPTVDGEPEALVAQTEEIGECELTEDLYFTAFEREWAADLAQRCTETEIKKHGHPPTDDYAERTEMRAWACFWLAAQLRRKGLTHQQARGYMEQYLGSHMVVSETKHPIIHEALGRAYGMDIYPLPVMESEEVRAAIEGFPAVLSEICAAIVSPETGVPGQSAKQPDHEAPAPSSATTSEATSPPKGPDAPKPAISTDTEPDDGVPQPEPDPYDRCVVQWFGCRLYLGKDNTQVARLFRHLLRHMGERCLSERLLGVVFDTSSSPREPEQQKKDLRKVVSKLRDRLDEHGLNRYVVIICEDPRGRPSYSMQLRLKP